MDEMLSKVTVSETTLIQGYIKRYNMQILYPIPTLISPNGKEIAVRQAWNISPEYNKYNSPMRLYHLDNGQWVIQFPNILTINLITSHISNFNYLFKGFSNEPVNDPY
jgi:hypothetical protein